MLVNSILSITKPLIKSLFTANTVLFSISPVLLIHDGYILIAKAIIL